MDSFLQTGLHRFVSDGAIFMWAILAVSLLSVFIAIERYLALRFRFGIDARRLFNEIKKYLTAKDYARALEICKQSPRVPLAEVLGAGLANIEEPIEEIDTAMESEAFYYVPKISERIGYLGVLANIATLLGLLGTISGLIASFHAIGGEATVDGVSKGEALAAGISVAMYTTAFGLVVAIPALFVHHYLMSWANRLIDDIQHYSTALKKIIQRIHGHDHSDEKPSKKKDAA